MRFYNIENEDSLSHFEKTITELIDTFLLMAQFIGDPLLCELCIGYQRKSSIIGMRPFEFPAHYTSHQLGDVYSAIKKRAKNPLLHPQTEPMEPIQTELGPLTDPEPNGIKAYLNFAVQKLERAEENLGKATTNNLLKWNELCRQILDAFGKLVAILNKSKSGR